jgi:NADPH:quinone reductase-like Zn-dependent oxidoreductase
MMKSGKLDHYGAQRSSSCWNRWIAVVAVIWSLVSIQSCHSFPALGSPTQYRQRAVFAMPSTPHGWVVPEGVSFGSLAKLQFQELPSKENKNGELVVQVATRAIGLNFADIFCVLGLYAAANKIRNNAAFVPGLEYAGVVVDDPTGTYEQGQRVLGFTRFGAYADMVEVPPEFLYPLPSNWTFQQGAGFLVQALTAWHGLVEVGRMPIMRDGIDYVVMVHSAAGGVGLWASEMAARRGATVIGVVGSSDKEQVFKDRILTLSPRSRTLIRGEERTFGKRLVQLLGEIYNTNVDDHGLTTLRECGKGVDIVMESLGGRYFADSFESLNSGGALVTFGSTSYVSPGLGKDMLRLIWRYLNRPKIDPGTLTARNIQLAGFNLIYLTEQKEELRRELNECIICLSGREAGSQEKSQGELASLDSVTAPLIGNVFDFRTQAISAMEMLKGGTTVGKVVLDNSKNPIS